MGGERLFVELVEIVLSILTGGENIEKYIGMFIEVLKENQGNYGISLVKLSTSNKKFIEKLKKKRSVKNESAEYQKYIRDYHDYMRDFLTKL